MNTEIIIAIISLVGIIITALVTKNSFTAELDKKIAVINTKLDVYGEDIRQHNCYAKMFHENIPVMREQIHEINQRLDKLER